MNKPAKKLISSTRRQTNCRAAAKNRTKARIYTLICLLMETFESTEMVPGRTARRVRLHCFYEIDLMPGGSHNCIFEGTRVREQAISALIVSLFSHLQKSCLKQTQFIYSNFLSVHKRKLVLRLGASTCSTSSSDCVDLLWKADTGLWRRCQ